MALNSKLIRRISNNSTSNIVHSSGYAKVQSGSSIGASDNTTFSQRQQIDQNRKVVQGYKDAHVVQRVNYTQKAMSVEEQQALAAAEAAASESYRGLSNVEQEKREFNSCLESGGIRKYDARNRESRFGTQNNSGQATNAGIARQAGAAGRQEAAAARAAMAERFSGHAHPVPKSGGFARH